MAATLWEHTDDGKFVVIHNQRSYKWDIDTWNQLKAKYTLTDEQLAKTLNNK